MWFVLCALRALKSHDCTFYAWFTLARKTENGIKQSAIFRRGKSWNVDVRIPETPPPPLSANLLPPSPYECGCLLWTAPKVFTQKWGVFCVRKVCPSFYCNFMINNNMSMRSKFMRVRSLWNLCARAQLRGNTAHQHQPLGPRLLFEVDDAICLISSLVFRSSKWWRKKAAKLVAPVFVLRCCGCLVTTCKYHMTVWPVQILIEIMPLQRVANCVWECSGDESTFSGAEEAIHTRHRQPHVFAGLRIDSIRAIF